MPLSNEIVLRPRFKMELARSNESALKAFEQLRTKSSEFLITRVDNHVFIKFPNAKRHFWSPQLHLEIDEIDETHSLLYGLYGPNPTVWTLFMFLHFIAAGLFIAAGIWAYSNWSLGQDFAIQLFITLLMIVLWVALYFIGRIGKSTGKAEMRVLQQFMNNTLDL